jgi:predicted nucleic acid-binding protein
MNGWLLDTDVLLQLAPANKPELNYPDFVAWLRSDSNSVFISAWSIAEITDVAGDLKREGRSTDFDELLTWVDRLISLYGQRILPLDAAVAKFAAIIMDELKEIDAHIPVTTAGILVAATASANNLALMTPDIEVFEPLKSVLTRNPFDPTNYE